MCLALVSSLGLPKIYREEGDIMFFPHFSHVREKYYVFYPSYTSAAQNHRITKVGRHLQRSSSPIPCLKEVQLEQVAHIW